jgi:hypothetical protein
MFFGVFHRGATTTPPYGVIGHWSKIFAVFWFLENKKGSFFANEPFF